MSNVQIWNGSTWINFYTLPNATSNTLGGVKIGGNITVSSGTISLTKNNVTSALGYTPLSLSGGAMTGNISYKGTKATYSMIKWIDNTADTYGNGIRIGGGGATIIGGGESADLPSVSGGDEILYLMNDGNIDFYSNCQGGLDSAKHMSFDTSGNLNVPYVRASGNIYEGGTSLANKYLSINTKEVVKTSGNQDVGGDKTFTGTLKAKNLFVAPPDANTGPRIKVYNQVDEYYVNMPASSGTIALTSQIPTYTAGTGLSLSNGAFSVKTGYTTNGKNYKVAADTNGNLYVNVPWTDTDTNTHYTNYLQIKGNGTEAVKFTQNADKSLNLKPGSNVSISAASGEITISATDTNSWRPVVDNLTSTDTDKSLSANQGKVLKGLVDGKAASNHTHSQYLTSQKYRPIKVEGVTLLANTIDTALNLKAGTNISLSNSNGTVTINSTASGGGGMTSTKIFEGAGDLSGYYTTTISAGNYKMLLFEVNISDFNFYLFIPTDYIKTASASFYFAVGNVYNGGMGIVEVTASNTNFSASVSSGNIIVYNVNVYAYK